MKRSKLLALLLMLMVSIAIQAQNVTASGTVMDSTGEPIIGASVVQVGNAGVGTITDIDGHYQISVPAGTDLQISYIGYLAQTVKPATDATIILMEDSEMLEDVVVIGYGVQKKSVVTASIARVSSEDLDGKTRLRAEDALKGLAAGVNVTSSSGQPGSKSLVRVRGIGTINDSNPLYIIDGMPGGQDAMELVNPGDIESIEVLKDASAAAVYGARGANGVILITTKKGKEGKAQINYNGSWGWQSAWKHRDVCSATDYAVLQNEKYLNGGQAAPYADPYNLTDANGNKVTGFGTDWQEELFNDGAPITQHDVSVSGATDRVNYYVSGGYFKQDGIIGGNYGQSNYERLTLRSNTQYKAFDYSDERSFLNKLDLSVNVGYMNVKSTGVSANSTWGSPLGSALYLSPILPVTLDKDGAGAGMIAQYSQYDLFTDANGNPYTIPGYLGSYQEQNNPIAMMQVRPNQGWSHKFMPKFSADLQIWDNIKYHFNFNAELSFWGNENATTQLYYLSGNNNADKTNASAYRGNNYNWQVENTITYDKTFGKHSVGVVLGQSALKESGYEMGGNRNYLINVDKPSINYATGQVELGKDADGNITGATAYFGVYGGPWAEHTMSSLFGRVSYNYDERYMAQVILRRDGSSRFGTNNKYGYFPSVSLGWNVMNEKFMESTRNWLSNFKVRGSWGKNGNENIGNFAYTTLTTTGGSNNYYYGKVAQMTIGSKAERLANPDLKWEESEQLDLGVDLGFWNQALTFTVDYYIKKTNGMIISMPIASYVGEVAPLANVGDMKNTGWEFELAYRGSVNDLHYSIKGNATYLKNTLNNIGNDTGFINYGISQFSGGGLRAENGEEFPYFYGYKTNGVFQNMAEVEAYVDANGNQIMPDAQPGDIRFADVNGDGKINEDDRTKIGSGIPDWTFGVNAGLDWKGLDFNMFWQGVAGADVFDATYRQDIASGNFPTWILGRWTGEGTSNRVPKLIQGDSKNWVVSDLYVFDGSYLRLKNITLGYTLPRNLTQKIGVERFRVYAMAENLFTFTKYHGFDPEIGSSVTSMGVDYGVYPQARTFTLGVNVTLGGGKISKK